MSPPEGHGVEREVKGRILLSKETKRRNTKKG